MYEHWFMLLQSVFVGVELFLIMLPMLQNASERVATELF